MLKNFKWCYFHQLMEDKDDVSSDCDETLATVRNIGKDILAEKGEIRACSKAVIEVLDVDKEVTKKLC